MEINECSFHLQLNALELALSYCDRVYECMHQPSSKNSNNIYLVLLQIYLNPRRTIAGFENIIKNLLSPQNKTIPKLTPTPSIKSRGQGLKKIVAIEGAKDTKVSLSSTDNGRSHGDADEYNEGGSTIMLDEVVDLLSHRWDRINGAQALKLLPKETKLQVSTACWGTIAKKCTNCFYWSNFCSQEFCYVRRKLYFVKHFLVSSIW